MITIKISIKETRAGSVRAPPDADAVVVARGDDRLADAVAEPGAGESRVALGGEPEEYVSNIGIRT